MSITKQNYYIIGSLILIILTIIVVSTISKKNKPGQSEETITQNNTQTSSPTTSPSMAVLASIQHFGPLDAQNLISNNENNEHFVILDIRTPDEFSTGHIKNARNLDFYASDIESQINSLDRNNTYLVYCRSGNRSKQFSSIMETNGFTNIYELTGGILAWQAESLPLEY